MIGYLPRDVAAGVRRYIDGLGGRPVPAVVTELTSDVSGTVVGMRVGFYVPTGSIARRTTATDYHCEESERGTVYVLFECDESALRQAVDAMRGGGVGVARWGLNYRAASNGRTYKWYVVLDDAVTEGRAKTVLRETVGIPPEEEIWDELVKVDNERRRLVDETAESAVARRRLEAELAALLERLRRLETERHERRTHRGKEIPKIIGTLLPQAIFLRDSMDVLTREIEICEKVLHDLRGIIERRVLPPGTKPVQEAPGWKESHFNTGHGRDGRLYFKQERDHCNVLVSFKRRQDIHQGSDIEYLQRN